MGMTIESRSPDVHRTHHTRMPARRKDAGEAAEAAPRAERTAAPVADKREAERVRVERRDEERRAEPPPREAPARSPGSGVQMDNDMLVWIQSQ